jgi:putative ABC transport system permease protein
MFKLPLSWLQLIRQRARLLVTLAGIAFIVILMFVQLGFQNALYSSATQVHQNLEGDLFLLSTQYKSLTSNQSFSRNRLYQALGVKGVGAVKPLYAQFAKLKNPSTGQKYSIYMMGFDPGKPVFQLAQVNQALGHIQLPNVVLFDRNARPEFGDIAQQVEQGRTQELEVFAYNATKGYRVKVGGLFDLGPSFGVDGNLIGSSSTFLRVFGAAGRQADMIDIGVILLKPEAQPDQTAIALKQVLPSDVQVFTRQEFIAFEKNYWSKRTPIGFTLNLMLVMGFVIGVVIVYQILYNNVSNHLIAYATLKAIGYTNSYLISVVFQQAVLLAVMGYIPGLLISHQLYHLAREITRLPILMTLDLKLLILSFMIVICMLSGLFAVNKLRLADPADIF